MMRLFQAGQQLLLHLLGGWRQGQLTETTIATDENWWVLSAAQLKKGI